MYINVLIIQVVPSTNMSYEFIKRKLWFGGFSNKNKEVRDFFLFKQLTTSNNQKIKIKTIMIGANFAKIATKKVCILVTEFTMKRIVLETEKNAQVRKRALGLVCFLSFHQTFFDCIKKFFPLSLHQHCFPKIKLKKSPHEKKLHSNIFTWADFAFSLNLRSKKLFHK